MRAHTAPEEQHILEEILSMWESFSGGAALRNDEISREDTVNSVPGRNATLIKIPRRLLDQVEKYVNALRAIESKAA